jgi:hypothetical protein
MIHSVESYDYFYDMAVDRPDELAKLFSSRWLNERPFAMAKAVEVAGGRFSSANVNRHLVPLLDHSSAAVRLSTVVALNRHHKIGQSKIEDMSVNDPSASVRAAARHVLKERRIYVAMHLWVWFMIWATFTVAFFIAGRYKYHVLIVALSFPVYMIIRWLGGLHEQERLDSAKKRRGPLLARRRV